MYKIRRVYRTKPGEARNVATLVYKQAKMYKDSGLRWTHKFGQVAK